MNIGGEDSIRVRGRRFTTAVAAATLLAAAVAFADPYPPYWIGGTGPAVHYAPVAWPATATFIAYTRTARHWPTARHRRIERRHLAAGLRQRSLGLHRPGAPSVYYAYDAAPARSCSSAGACRRRRTTTPRVRTPAATPRPAPGAPRCGPCSWTPTATATAISPCISTAAAARRRRAIDRLAGIWSTTKSQSLDYINDPADPLARAQSGSVRRRAVGHRSHPEFPRAR